MGFAAPQAGLWWLPACWELFACRTNSSESQGRSLCARGGVSGGLGHLSWCQWWCPPVPALLGEPGLLLSRDIEPSAPWAALGVQVLEREEGLCSLGDGCSLPFCGVICGVLS